MFKELANLLRNWAEKLILDQLLNFHTMLFHFSLSDNKASFVLYMSVIIKSLLANFPSPKQYRQERTLRIIGSDGDMTYIHTDPNNFHCLIFKAKFCPLVKPDML